MDLTNYFKHAELALSAYANLIAGILDSPSQQEALQQAGLSNTQATDFAENWRVIDQYNHSEMQLLSGTDDQYIEVSNGLSVAVFEEIESGKRYLAIRGTNDLQDFITDVIDIGLLGTTRLQEQYHSLRNQVQAWLDDGTLPSTFTVSGHSLGGFLATGLAAEFSNHVEHTYLYNAPGVSGLAATFNEFFPQGILAFVMDALSLHELPPIDPTTLSNITARAGLSPIAGLGLQVSTPILIGIENQSGTDDPGRPGSGNHSQRVLTDALERNRGQVLNLE